MNFGNGTRSPSAREKERVRKLNTIEEVNSEAMSAFTGRSSIKEDGDVKAYLNQFSVDDLRNIIRDRKSKKHLGSGPIVGGRKTDTGDQRAGNSVPVKVLRDKEHEYGVSSYHKGQHLELKDVLSNQFIKDSMIERVVKEAASKVNSDREQNRDWRNNAYNQRSSSI